MVEIRPDPKHPHGGYAELLIDSAGPAEGAQNVAIFNSYQQKWLGDQGWQAERKPLAVHDVTQDKGQLRLILGPGIVNHLEEDTPIRIELGDESYDLYWPDDIMKGPDEAVIGDIGNKAAPKPQKGPTLQGVLPGQDEDSGNPEGDGGDMSDGPDEGGGSETIVTDPTENDRKEEGGNKTALIIGGVGFLIAALIAVWFFFLREESAPPPPPPPEEEVTTIPEPAIAPPAPVGLCSAESLTGLMDQGFGVMANQLRSCGSDVSADLALRLLEQGVGAGDGDALALFGAIYDNTVTDPEIEEQIGLNFGDNPALAAEYYARARDAGSQEAATRLTGLCRRLLLLTDTLSQGAHEDYCQTN